MAAWREVGEKRQSFFFFLLSDENEYCGNLMTSNPFFVGGGSGH